MRYLVILILLLSTGLIAQTDHLKGRVLSQSGDEPLAHANVFIKDKNIGTATNQMGYFELKGDIDQNDNLVISYIGYEKKEIDVSELDAEIKNTIYLKRQILSSQTVLVKGSIGEKGTTPTTFSNIEREEIEESYKLQDIPEYLSYLPSTTFYSEGGSGIGYNYLSIRGFDQRRISVSVNGIPQNDPEDHNIYWLDMPDILASTEMIQVQRGAGSGVTGYPAIGGSINIITSNFTDEHKFDVSTSYGSYHTRKQSASFSSGLIDEKYSIYAKLSHIRSSGYRDGAWVDFKSYHLSAVRYDENLTTQINLYGGPIADGLTYTGLPKFAVDDKEMRKENYSFWSADKGQYTYKLPRRPSEKENFHQPHFELLNEYQFSDEVVLNSALFLVYGKGFFDYDASWADTSYFRLTNEFGFNPDRNPQNALIRAWVDNTQYGWIPRLSIEHTRGRLILGAELRKHRSEHWGSINYGQHLPANLSKKHRYYSYKGGKDIFNIFANEKFDLSHRVNILAEAQLSYNNYMLYDEKYVGYDFEVNHLFFNPRVGLNYKFSPALSSYVSFARVNREPRLKTYYDAAESSGGETPQFERNTGGSYNFDEPLVSPETMNDVELGFHYSKPNYNLSLNFFYMLFNNEIVSQGQTDRFGQPITGNVDKTIHSGIEVSGTGRFLEHFELILNGSYSRNYISSGKTFVNYTDVNGNSQVGEIDLSDNRISGFPNVTVNGILKFHYDGFLAQIFSKYVGSIRSDNYDDNLNDYLNKYPGFVSYDDNKVESYFVMDLMLSYNFDMLPFFTSGEVFFKVDNVFDNLYAAYAIGKEFFPAAERNFLTGIKVGL